MKASRFSAVLGRLVGKLTLAVLVMIPITAQAGVLVFGSQLGITQQGAGGTVLAFPDVTATPNPPGGITPIPYPVIGSAETDSGTGKTKVTTTVVIRSEKIDRTAGAQPALTRGIISPTTLGFLGDILQLSWETLVPTGEMATLSLSLSDPTTGQPIGAAYQVGISDSQSGSIAFDLVNAPVSVFDLVISSIQTTDLPQPSSLLSITDITLDGVSVAGQFSVAPIPLPSVLLLMVIGLAGLALLRRPL